MSSRLGTLAALVTLAGCSDVDLVGLSKKTVTERLSLSGQVCAPRHVDLEVPYRVLFVIDTSLSNEWNDPTKRRVTAVKQAIDTNLPRQNVSFGVITFSDVPRVQTLAFTRDPLVLAGAISHIETPQGATNYADTMWTVKSFLLDDLNALPPLEAARTHYLVFWLSDGFPTVGTTDPRSIVPMVSTLRGLVAPRVNELRIDTAFLGARTSSAAEATEAVAAKSLLESMATAGGGRFNDIPQGQAFSFEINLTPQRAFFQLEAIVATNRNLVLGEKGPEADSDADGMSDVVEEAFGLDPVNDDSDGDGFRDGVEWNSTGRLDPLTADSPACTSKTDSDGDGLRDCEEAVLSTLPGTVDTDQDRLPDGLELLGSGTPVDNRPTLDRDEDGIPDQVELRAHLPALIHNDAKTAEGWGYRYEVHALPRDPTAPDVGCYQVSVENLAMVPTRETADHPAGVNAFELHAVFALEAGTAPRWIVSRFEGRVMENPYVLVPASNRFTLDPSQFAQLP